MSRGSSIPAIATPITRCNPSAPRSVSVPCSKEKDEAARAQGGDRDHQRREAAREPGRAAHAGISPDMRTRHARW
jgi:hypothetical protein